MIATSEVKKPRKQKARGMIENVMEQFHSAADIIELHPSIRKILSITNNEIVVHFPVKLDNGDVEIFTGYRVQHNNALGPYKGGLRYHPTVDIDAAKALAMWMTWKTSLAGLPYGGGKGGIQLDPKKYSKSELERITRRFTFALADNIGPEHDIPAPDVNTNSQTMAWMADTYMSTRPPAERSANQHVVTGKPAGSGGLEGRDRADRVHRCHATRPAPDPVLEPVEHSHAQQRRGRPQCRADVGDRGSRQRHRHAARPGLHHHALVAVDPGAPGHRRFLHGVCIAPVAPQSSDPYFPWIFVPTDVPHDKSFSILEKVRTPIFGVLRPRDCLPHLHQLACTSFFYYHLVNKKQDFLSQHQMINIS